MGELVFSWIRKIAWQTSNQRKHVWLLGIPVATGCFVAWATSLIADGSGKPVEQWLQDYGLPSLMTLLIAASVITFIAVLGVAGYLVSKANAELAAIRPQFDTLTSRQRELLNALLPSGRSSSSIARNSKGDLEFICEHTAFLKRDGSDYELNEHTRKTLSLLLRLDKSIRKQWHETPENELTASDDETASPLLTSADPLDAVRLAEVRSEWGKLTTEQQRLLRRILVSGGLSWDQIDVSYWKRLPVYQESQLSDYLLERSTLLGHKSKGNADLRRYIEVRKAGKTDITLGLRTWNIKAEFINALQQVIAEPVAALRDTHGDAESRELDITFDKTSKGFVRPFSGESYDGKSVVDWKLYRVAVTSHTTSPGTRLRVVDLDLLNGDVHPSLSLRVKGDPEAKEFKLHAEIPQFWDVVEKPVGEEHWLRLLHTEKTAGTILLKAPRHFTITASSDQGVQVSKLVTLDIDKANNNELIFQLSGVEEIVRPQPANTPVTLKPNIVLLKHPTIAFLKVEADNTFFNEKGGALSVVASFRNEVSRECAPCRADNVSARIVYFNSNNNECCSVSHGTWLREHFNRISFDVGSERTLVLGVIENSERYRPSPGAPSRWRTVRQEGISTVRDNREGVSTQKAKPTWVNIIDKHIRIKVTLFSNEGVIGDDFCFEFIPGEKFIFRPIESF